MNSENNSSSVSVKIGVALAVFVGIGVGLIVASKYLPSKTTTGQMLNGQEIAKSTGMYLSQSTVKNGQVFSVTSCDSAGKCEVAAMPDPVPALAWRILGLAGVYKATGKEEIKATMKEDFKKFASKANSEIEMYSLHQIYEAYKATGDEDYLAQFGSSAMGMLDQVTITWQPGVSLPSMMMVGAVERQLGQLYAVLGDKQAVAVLQKRHDWFPKDDQIPGIRETVLKTAQRLFDDIPDTDYDLACFEPWGKYSVYTATGDKKLLDEIKAFFAKNEKSLENHSVAQFVLPCLDVLKDLAATDPSYDALFKRVAENVVLKAWDSSVSKKCSGDGGFFPKAIDPSKRVGGCSNLQKFVTDSAWASFIFGQRKDLFEVS